MRSLEPSITFYDTHYDILRQWFLRPGDTVVLGDKQNRVCRFCGRTAPEASFRKVAHAIPEALGNRSIESTYECDDCNEKFGQGIENDLGNWSQPTRTFTRIRGKSGVPTLKRGGPNKNGWRIEHGTEGFQITSYEDETPPYDIDEENQRITFRIKRGAYTPVAVLKAFIKIGLTLLPDEEIDNFSHLMAWLNSSDHSQGPFNRLPLIRTFHPGPMPNDLIAAFILRRKSHITNYPYMFLVLSYGNEVFQVPLPSERYDRAAPATSISMLAFPSPGLADPERFGASRVEVLDMSSHEVVRGEVLPIQLHFDSCVAIEGSEAD